MRNKKVPETKKSPLVYFLPLAGNNIWDKVI